MKILLLNHYAGTPALGMEYRPYYLAREWVRLGHQVQVIAADHSHVRARQPQAGDELIDGIAYRWLPTPPYAGNGWGRMKNILSYMSQVWAQADALAAQFQPDVVIASSTYPMDNWLAQRIAARVQPRPARWVYEVHDLWPLSPIELSGMSPWHPFALICQAAESAAYKSCDVVVSMLPKVQGHMSQRGLDLRKLAIVPNGISPEEWQAAPEPLRDDVAQALAQARERGHAVVGYAGSMGLPNALSHLLEAAALLQGAPMSFLLVGDGHERAALQRQWQALQAKQASNVQQAQQTQQNPSSQTAAPALPPLVFLPPIPKAQVPAFLAAIDIAFIGWQQVPIYRFGIAPNKLMDYMMAAKPVLHSVQAGNDPVLESGCGLTVQPEDPAAIAAGLHRLAALSPRERRAMGERGRSFVLRHHSYPVLAARFLAAVEGAR